MAFATNLAAEVATGDMAADAQNPDGSVNVEYLYNQPLTCPTYVMPGTFGNPEPAEYRTPHWYTTPEAEYELANNRNPFEFGVAMHQYQDSFSHWQKLGKPATPQGIWAGHFGDNITSDRGFGTRASIDTFNPTEDTIDQAMLTGMTEGFAYEQIVYLAQYQLESR